MGIQMDELDVLVGGGGYVGLSLAVALKQADPGLRVAVVDNDDFTINIFRMEPLQ